MFNNSLGSKGFTWFIGVVEDRNDPLKMGRVRVRCYGYHTEDKDQIPTKELPWAIMINPIDSASISGVGKSPTGIVEGSWVVGFFLDGEDAQDPAIFGTIPSMSAEGVNTALGFNDPTGKFPRYTNESDVNKLARGENDRRQVPDAVIGEPTTSYNAQYPYNHVYQSESGHTKEYDDTPYAERIREKHRSGTEYEIHPDGTKTTHIVSDNYTVIAGSDNIHIKRKRGRGGNLNVYIDGNANMNVGGNYSLSVNGRYDVVAKRGMRFLSPRIDFNPSFGFGSLFNNRFSLQRIGNALGRVLGAKIANTIASKFGNVELDAVDDIPQKAAEIEATTCTEYEVGTDAYDNQTVYIQKIVDDVLNKLNWSLSPAKFLEDIWAGQNKEYYFYDNQEDWLEEAIGEEGVLVARIDDFYKKPVIEQDDGTYDRPSMTVNYFYYYTPQKTKEVILQFFKDIVLKIRESGNGEELYGVLSTAINKTTPLHVFRRIVRKHVYEQDKQNPLIHTGPIWKPDEEILGALFFAQDALGNRTNEQLMMMETTDSPLDTLLHEIGGHQFHKAKWGEDGLSRVLLGENEVDNLYEIFSNKLNVTKIQTSRRMVDVINEFTALSFYPKAKYEDEFMARVFAFLGTNKCTTFEEHIYPTLNRVGVEFSKETIKDIDAEMASMGLTFNRSVENYKPDQDITYIADAGGKTVQLAEYIDPNKVGIDVVCQV